MLVPTDTTTATVCRYCLDAPELRQVDVIVGAHPGHLATLLIDVEPHPDGRVIRRLDGQWRLLAYVANRKKGVAGYRVHGASMWAECEGDDPSDD